MQTFNLRFSSLYVSLGTRTFTITLMNTSTNNQISVCHFNIWTCLAFASKRHKPPRYKRKFVSVGYNFVSNGYSFVAYARQQGKLKSERDKWHCGFLTSSPHYRQFLVLFVCTSPLGTGIQGGGGGGLVKVTLELGPRGTVASEKTLISHVCLHFNYIEFASNLTHFTKRLSNHCHFSKGWNRKTIASHFRVGTPMDLPQVYFIQVGLIPNR